jgi:hypothetical protein
MKHLRVTATFRECIENGQIHATAIGKLPEELATMIVKAAGPALEAYRQRWLPLLECYQTTCEPTKRYSAKAVEKASSELPFPGHVTEYDLRNSPLHRNAHASARAEVHKALSCFVGWNANEDRGAYNWVGTHRLLKYMPLMVVTQTLSVNFGMEMYFTMEETIRGQELLAYLTKPAQSKRHEPQVMTAVVVGPSILEQPWDSLKAQFETVLKELDLELVDNQGNGPVVLPPVVPTQSTSIASPELPGKV